MQYPAIQSKRLYVLAFLAGTLLPFGFSPFHFSGLVFFSLAYLFYVLTSAKVARPFLLGFLFGLGYFGLGVSWVFVSIHTYGHLNYFLSACITLLFVMFFASFIGLFTTLFQRLAQHDLPKVFLALLFSGLWCLTEFCRAHFLTGFPWLLLGFSQTETPLKYALPLIGVYGVSFLVCLIACMLCESLRAKKAQRIFYSSALIGFLLLPMTLSHIRWTKTNHTPISVSVIQANLSMRDKWDESLFLNLLHYYKTKADALMGKKDLIVMPESAIPAPISYVTDFLEYLDEKALNARTAILLGIPEESRPNVYHNSLLALGLANGSYQKKHLVPFGEFIPSGMQRILDWLAIPMDNLTAGKKNQLPIEVNGHPIASLICYEIAYPELLRHQLPEAELIVSVSDDGWFGHSFAMYQQLQMAKVLSIMTSRYQIVANNDGLSSVINREGHIMASLPAYQPGILQSQVFTTVGETPWVYWGDWPILVLSLMIIGYVFLVRIKLAIAGMMKRRYPSPYA